MNSYSQRSSLAGSAHVSSELQLPILENNRIDDLPTLHTTPDQRTGLASTGNGIERLFHHHQSHAFGTMDRAGKVLLAFQLFLGQSCGCHDQPPLFKGSCIGMRNMYASSNLNSWYYPSSGNNCEDTWLEETMRPKDFKVICRFRGTLPNGRRVQRND